uniref:Reverse transcriptase domain-containing protein n=1 Tax=Leptobrachium leishanense TaxID=445787 RepID=A0A8C5MK06_9ANUR
NPLQHWGLNNFEHNCRLQDQKQHGFTSGRSCQTNLIDFFDWVTKIVDTGGAVDIAYLDFSKAFDTVPHRRLINKLQSLSLDSNIVEWIRQWLSDRQQRVVVNGVYSAQGLVTSGVPQGSVLGPILFNIIAYLDFSKAFDTVPHRRLINKLQSLSLDSNIVEWIRQWLSDRQQRVVVNGVYSAQGLVTSGVPQGSVLGPILFNIFISDIAEGINVKVCLFADDTKICNRVDVPGGISQMTNDLGKLKKWWELWQLSFNVDKCKIMHLGRKNPRAEYRILIQS